MIKCPYYLWEEENERCERCNFRSTCSVIQDTQKTEPEHETETEYLKD